MTYNKAREEHKWKQWKEKEEEILRREGMEEEKILSLRESDWNDFNADRRFKERNISLLDYMELLLELNSSQESQVRNVKDLLDSVSDEQILQVLRQTERETLQILLLRTMGYTIKEVSHYMDIPEQTVYTRLRRLKEKINKMKHGK